MIAVTCPGTGAQRLFPHQPAFKPQQLSKDSRDIAVDMLFTHSLSKDSRDIDIEPHRLLRGSLGLFQH